MSGLLGKKLGMTQCFSQEGESVPVSVLQAGPCAVVQRKTKSKEGYDAIQVSFERHRREFRCEGENFEAGQTLTVEIFKVGDQVDVVGTSKGKGFQGVIKRHGKAGGPASHGSRFHRSTGSIGQRTSPGEVFKNMKLPGHLGSERVTVKNLEVVEVRAAENLLLVRGAVPGAKNGLLRIQKVKNGRA